MGAREHGGSTEEVNVLFLRPLSPIDRGRLCSHVACRTSHGSISTQSVFQLTLSVDSVILDFKRYTLKYKTPQGNGRDHMALIPMSEPREVTQDIEKLDENVVERLSSRNRKQGLCTGTKETYQSAIRDFNRFLAQNEQTVTEESLKRYFSEVRGRLKASTLNLRKYALMKCLKAQVGGDSLTRTLLIEKVFEQIPTYQTDKTVPPDKCPSESEVIKLVEVAPTQKTALIIRFLFKSACRVSEALNIRLTDCYPVGENLRIQIFGKGNKARNIEIPFALYDAIRQEYGGQKYLFESKSGRKLLRQNVEKQIKRAGRKIGKNISPHAMRHARATDIHLNKGISLTATSRLLGHSDPSITAKMYVHDTINYTELFARDRI